MEPVNLCNLACSYCLREDDHLHKDPAAYLSLDLLDRVLQEARAACGADEISIAGGEPTLHPGFGRMIEIIRARGYRFGLVTNGWHFKRIRAALVANRDALHLIAFSVDGATEESHDAFRGRGSFKRLMGAIADCHALGFPVRLKVVLHRANAKRIEALTLFAARLGAKGITFAHLLPTSPASEQTMALNDFERVETEREIGVMGRIMRMDVSFAAGYVNTDPQPPCQVLGERECNIDYAGRMSLCCNLSGFRGSIPDRDVVADLNGTSFADGLARLSALVQQQNAARRVALTGAGLKPTSRVTSPCEICLTEFQKTPWSRGVARPQIGRVS